MENPNNIPENEAVRSEPMSPAEIARLEREAAMAVARGESPKTQADIPAQEAPAAETPAAPDPNRYAEPEIGDDKPDDDDDDAPKEWVPSRFEKKIHAIPEKTWNLWQTVGGVVIGLIVLAALFLGGAGLNYFFIAALVLALVGPNILEDRGRCKLTRGRMVMIIVIGVGLVIVTVYLGFTKGWNFFAAKEEAETALNLARVLL